MKFKSFVLVILFCFTVPTYGINYVEMEIYYDGLYYAVYEDEADGQWVAMVQQKPPIPYVEPPVTYRNYKFDGVKVIPKSIPYNGKDVPVVAIGPRAFSLSANPVDERDYTLNVKMQEGIKTIMSGAFASNPIESVDLPSTLEIIEAGAFSGTHIKKYVIPASTKSVESLYCGFAEEIVVESGNKVFTVIDGALCDTVNKTFKAYPVRREKVAIYTIPSLMKSIAGLGALSCINTDMLIIPESVESVGFSDYSSNKASIVVVNAKTNACNFCQNGGVSNLLIGPNVENAGSLVCSPDCRKDANIFVFSKEPINDNETIPICGSRFGEITNGELTYIIKRREHQLYVPKGTTEAYKNTIKWCAFKDYNEHDKSFDEMVEELKEKVLNGISDVELEEATSVPVVYDLFGRRVSKIPNHGIFIEGGKKVMR